MPTLSVSLKTSSFSILIQEVKTLMSLKHISEILSARVSSNPTCPELISSFILLTICSYETTLFMSSFIFFILSEASRMIFKDIFCFFFFQNHGYQSRPQELNFL